MAGGEKKRFSAPRKETPNGNIALVDRRKQRKENQAYDREERREWLSKKKLLAKEEKSEGGGLKSSYAKTDLSAGGSRNSG